MDKSIVKRKRRFISRSDKELIAKERVVTGISVSNLSKKYNIAPAALYRYVKEYGAMYKKDSSERVEIERIAALEKENDKLRDIILDMLMTDYSRLLNRYLFSV